MSPNLPGAKARPFWGRASRIKSVFFFVFAYGALVLASSVFRPAKLADLSKLEPSTPLPSALKSTPAQRVPLPVAPASAPARLSPKSVMDSYQQGQGFEENKGQFYDQNGNPNLAVKYLIRQPGLNVQLLATGFSYDTYVVEKPEADPADERKGPGSRKKGPARETRAQQNKTVKYHRVDIDLLGANPDARVEADEPVEATTNYFKGNGVERKQVRQFRRVVYKDIYPGIDLEFLSRPSEGKPIEYNFIVHPGADASRIQMRYNGANQVDLVDGNIVLQLAGGELQESIPASWVGKESNQVKVSYARKPGNVFGFQTPAYDRSQTLTIDPTPRLAMGTFLFSNTGDVSVYGTDHLAVDASGNIYVTFETYTDGLATSGAFQTTRASSNDSDALIAKVSPQGKLLAATYFGGIDYEGYTNVAVNADGVYLMAYTESPNLNSGSFPAAPSAPNYDDILLAKFDHSLSNRIWSRYVGGTDYDNYSGSAAFTLDAAGNLIVVSNSTSPDYPAQGLPGDNTTNAKIVATKLNASGTILWSGVVAQGGDRGSMFYVNDVKTDSASNIVVLGAIDFSYDAPHGDIPTPGAYKSTNSGDDYDMFLMKLSGATGIKLWGTLVGGEGYESYEYGTSSLALDNAANPWILFYTDKDDIPTTANAFQRTVPDALRNASSYYVQFVKLSQDGQQALYSSFYMPTEANGAVYTYYMDLDVDLATNDVYIAASYEWDQAPVAPSGLVTDCAFQVESPDPNEATIVAKFNSNYEREWSTLWGYTFDIMSIEFRNNRLHIASVLDEPLEEATTPGAQESNSGGNTGFWLTALEEGFIPTDIALSPNSIDTLQEACAGGIPKSILGSKVSITGPENYSSPILYQWQASPDQNTWTDIPGATEKNFSPEPGNADRYFRRIVSLPGPAVIGGPCEDVPMDTSNVHTFRIRTAGGNLLFAPTATIADGPRGYTCPGSSVTLSGSASGGSGGGYTYKWFVGSDTMAASTTATLTNSPSVATIYTLRVTDSNGCFGLDQIPVTTVSGNAGADKSFCEGSSGVQIGPNPIQGTPLVQYAWASDASLSCTTCAQPVAMPASATSYYLTVTVNKLGGGTCTMLDTVLVTPVASPGANFAGADQTVCKDGSSTAQLGIPSVSGFTYAWSPGAYLSSPTTARPTFQPGAVQVPSQLQYTLTATKSGCTFVDYVKAFSIYPNVNETTLCGTKWVTHKGPVNPEGTVYAWEKVSGDGTLTILKTQLGGAEAQVKLGSGNTVVFRRKATLNGVSCYSGNITLGVCSGSSNNCTISRVDILDAPNCPIPSPSGYRVAAIGVDGTNFNFRWSPANAFDDPTKAVPRVVSQTPNLTISVTATSKDDTTNVCTYSLVVNNSGLSLPVFSAPDKFNCPKDTISIGLANNSAYTYSWNNTSGMIDATNARFSSNPRVALSSGTQSYVVTVKETATGCTMRDTVRVQVANVRANAGADKTVCAGATVLIGTPVDTTLNRTYSWSPAAPWANGTNGNSPQPELTFATDLEMILTVSDPASGCSIKDTVLLKAPTGSLFPGVAADTICPGGSTKIKGTPVQGVTYSWLSPTTGLSATNIINPVASPTATTTYTLRAAGCGSPVDTMVTVLVNAAPDFTLTDKTICPSTGAAIGIGATGNTGSLANVASYAWTPTSNLSAANVANPTAKANKATTYTLKVTYTNGCSVSKTLNVAPSPGTAADAGPDFSVCAGETVTLGSAPVSGSTYAWSPSTGLDNPTSAQPQANPTTTTVYTLTVTNGSCTATDSAVVSIKALPALEIQGNTNVCLPGSTTLSVNASGSVSYQWLGTAIESPNSPSTVVRPTANQRYKIIQTHRTTGCTGSAEVFVSVTQAGFAVDTTPTRQLVICQGDSVVLPLKITPSTGNYQYAWTPSPSLSNAFAKNPAARPTATTTYTSVITNLANNCQTSVSVPVRVVPIEDCAGDEYGDAPLSYENNGDPAKHGIVPTLRIGNYIDADNGGNNAATGGLALGDDNNQYPDEDGVGAVADIQYSENAYELVINNVFNDTASVAYLVAWADFDRNGTFDDDERSDVLSVPRDSIARVLGLSWQGFNPTRSLTPGRTYLRVRLTSDVSGNWLQNPSPHGYRADGEVEDYSFNIVRFFPFPDFGVTDKNVPLSGDLGINDQGRSAGVAYLAATPGQNNPSPAALTVNQNGTYSFPGASPGVYTFRVPAFNGVDTAFFSVTISVLDPDTDNPPMAHVDIAETVVNQPVTIRTVNNDLGGRIGVKVQPTTVEIVTPPATGSVSVNPTTGAITFTPGVNFIGTISYTYRVKDTLSGQWSYADQFVSVIPAGGDNSILTSHDVALVPAAFKSSGNVLLNDIDAQGDSMSVTPDTVVTPDYTFILAADGSYTFKGSPSFTGKATFTYTACDDGTPQACSENILDIVVRRAVSGVVWYDDNRNGKREDTLSLRERKTPGVIAQLYTCAGTAVPNAQVTTDSSGEYAFPIPAAGSYKLNLDFSGIAQAADHKFTIPNIEANSADSTDSDILFDNNGFSACFTISSGTVGTSFDGGIFADADNDFRPDSVEANTTDANPFGVLYCENFGQIIPGGTISATGPGTVYVVQNGSTGAYQLLVDAAGVYTLAVTYPSGYHPSLSCTGRTDTLNGAGVVTVGSRDANMDGFLDNDSCAANTYYYKVRLAPGDLVENNNFPLQCLDLGDLPTGYPVTLAQNGARHFVPQNPTVFLGSSVDRDANGQPEANAGQQSGGDDGNGADDENGVTKPSTFYRGQTATFTVSVQTNTKAYVYGYIDWNFDKDFADSAEVEFDSITTTGTLSLVFDVPQSVAIDSTLGARFRIGTVRDEVDQVTGFAIDGEVEDYVVLVRGDSDNDGIPDIVEDPNANGIVDPGETDPNNPDTDGDGIDDGIEDADRDGQFDPGETDPLDTDSDSDGIDDGIEDANQDGIVDSGETDPRDVDTDNDGISDGVEDANQNGQFDLGETDPLDTDTDADGVDDGVEDADKDGMVDPGEIDPRIPDTDGDGVLDGQEVAGGNNPLDPCDPIQNPGYTAFVAANAIWAAADCDGDGYSNGQELTMKTDPYSGFYGSDMQVTYTGLQVSGRLSTNDLPGVSSFGPVQRDPNNPNNVLPVLNPNGTYTFSSSVPGTYRFTISVCPPGATANCPLARLEIQVLTAYATNNTPLAAPDRATTKEGQSVLIRTLANDGPGSGGILLNPASVRVITPPNASTEGTTSVDASTGNIRFTPAAGFSGIVRYSYEVCDNQLPVSRCDTGFQELTVLGSGSPNTTFGADDYRMAVSGVAATGNVLLNDVDADGDTPVAIPMDTTIAGVGRVVLQPNGDYVFYPDSAFQGTLSLPYTACSTSGGTTRCARNTLYVLTTPPPLLRNPDQVLCHTATTMAISFNTSFGGFIYSWTNDKPSIGLPASGTGNIAPFMAINTGTTPDTATIRVTAVINGLVAAQDTFLIIVTPGMRAGAASQAVSVCVNTAIPSITHATSQATSIGTVLGLPAGVQATWAAGQITIQGTPTAVGTFSYRIPLLGGCATDTARGTITVHPYPDANITDISATRGVVCKPGPVTLLGTGGVSYRWNTGDTLAQITIDLLETLDFTVTVTGTGGCASVANMRIAVNAPIEVSAAISPTCSGGSTGAIDLSVQGGTAPYRYSWSNRATTQDLASLAAGAYTVRIEDANGCSVSESFIVNGSLAAPVLGITIPEAFCAGSPATVVLNPSQAMRITYRIGDGALETINTLTSAVPLFIGNVLTDTELFVQSAVSLATGCSVVGNSMRRTVKVLQVPTLSADNISVCSDERFEIPVRIAATSTTKVVVDWRANYAGATGGLVNGTFVAGEGSIVETLRNSSPLTVSALYTLTPTVIQGDISCPGPEYRVRVQVQPSPSLEAVGAQEVCSGTAFTIPLKALNAANPVISWSSGESLGGGDIADVLYNTGTSVRELTYTARISSGGCTGPVLNIPVRVRSLPVLKVTAPADVCDGAIDLTAASVTTGSGTGLALSYWKDRKLSVAVEDPRRAVSGLYYISAQDAAGCVSAAPVLAQTALRLRVTPPPAVCAGGRADLTAASVTAGSESGLVMSYWQDASATQAVADPKSVPVGRYYIKAQGSGGTCFAVSPVDVVELRPRLLNREATVALCSGTEFHFSPVSNLPGAEFSWTRSVQPGLGNAAASGNGAISEVLTATSGTAVQVRYAYRLRAQGCSLVGSEMDTLSVTLQPLPSFGLSDSTASCSPLTDLRGLVSNPSGYTIGYSYDAEGKRLVLNPAAAPHGSYFVTATSVAGCAQTRQLTVFSRTGAPLSLDTTLEYCPPTLSNLSALVGSRGFTERYKVSYYQDINATILLEDPTRVAEGTYYLVLRDTAESNVGCSAVLPIEVKLGVASMDSPLEVDQHCGGTVFRYVPRSEQQGVTFVWELLKGDAENVPGGNGLSVLLNNNTDSIQTVRFRITARRNVCPNQASSPYLLDVEVLPRPALMALAPQATLKSGDSLLVSVALERSIATARLNWDASYTGVEGGVGQGRRVPFGPRAIAERLYNLGDTEGSVRYVLTPVLPGTVACTGDTAVLTLSVGPQGGQAPASVSGAVATRQGAGVEGVELGLSGQARVQTQMSGTDGRFGFAGLRGGYDYTLRPFLDKEPLNGVSTRDLIVLQQHLLGIKPIQDPYDLIAADVNNSKAVTVADMIGLRRLILGIDTRFATNTSWRFVDKGYRFPVPSNPWYGTFAELRNYNDLAGSLTTDFVGVKIGDLTGDARANSGVAATGRSGSALVLETEDAALRAGSRISVPVRVSGAESWDGMQFTLGYERRALRLITEESTFGELETVGLFPEDGLLTCSWGKPLQGGDRVLLLRFEVLRDGRLGDWLEANSRLTLAEAYRGEETRPVELSFTQPLGGERPRAMQNYPNPFTGQTQVPFWLPVEGQVWLRVYDLTGRLVLERSGIFPRGSHRFELRAEELGTGNAWFYQVGGADWVESRQMTRF